MTSRSKMCCVPFCSSSSSEYPNKLFFPVPNNRDLRAKWFKLAKRSYTDLPMYFCEDHFVLPRDMENYMEYHIMGHVSRVKITPGMLPSNFDCQPNYTKYDERKVKRNPAVTILKNRKRIKKSPSFVQIKDVRSIIQETDSAENPHSEFDSSDDDPSYLEKKEFLATTVKRIKRKPMFYIGLPKEYYHFINLIHEETNIPEPYILLCFKKIRLNSKVMELADDFGMSTSFVNEIFCRNIPLIANVMRRFFDNLNEIEKKNPEGNEDFSCIIDCFEIKVDNPSTVLKEIMSWPTDGQATVKYLISFTPHGLVNFVSPGFGEIITENCLIKTCNFVKSIKYGVCMIANSGVKYIEEHLSTTDDTAEKVVKSEKSPKVAESLISSIKIQRAEFVNDDDRKLKDLIHSFEILNVVTGVQSELVDILDDIIVIVCGLINIQI